MPQATCAASITMVPAPQHGSNNGPSASRPCQPAAASSAAARVSFNGASPFSPCASRQPRLNSASPDVSAYSVAWVGDRCRVSGRSGNLVSMLGRSPAPSRTTSQTASLTRSVAKFRLCSGERWAVVSMRKVCAGVIQSPQGTARASAYRWCSFSYGPCTSGHSTRWARRLSRFSRMAASASPITCRPPRSTCTAVPAPRMRCTSSASSGSTPAAQGRNSATGASPTAATRRRGETGAGAAGGAGPSSAALTSPCAGWPARSSAPRGIWPPCGAPPGCPARPACRPVGCQTAA